MSMVTLATAKAQSRILLTGEDTLIQGYLDAAELHAQVYLQRNVYPDQTAWDADRVALTDNTAANAEAAYNAAIALIGIYANGNFGFDSQGQPTSPTYVQSLARDKAVEDFTAVKNRLARILYGMLLNATFRQAVVLIAADFYENRESTLTELGDAIELPFSAKNLLWPDRRQMGV